MLVMIFEAHFHQFGSWFYVSILQINDSYEFPFQLDLDRDNGKYLSPDVDRSVHNLYTLHRKVIESVIKFLHGDAPWFEG